MHFMTLSCQHPHVRAVLLGVALIAAACASHAAVAVNIKFALQGAAQGGNLPMATDLNTNGVLPLTDPYGATVTLASIPATMVDWVNVELMSGSSPATCNAVQSRPALLLASGAVVDPVSGAAVNFSSAAPGSYNIRIRHRNHAALISTAQTLAAAAGPVVDFTLAGTLVNSGNAMTLAIGGQLAARSGDINQDGVIDGVPLGSPPAGSDYIAVHADATALVFGAYLATDIYMDSAVDNSDETVMQVALAGGNVAVPFTYPTLGGAACGTGVPVVAGNTTAIPALSPALLVALSALMGLAGAGMRWRRRQPQGRSTPS